MTKQQQQWKALDDEATAITKEFASASKPRQRETERAWIETTCKNESKLNQNTLCLVDQIIWNRAEWKKD